MTQGTIVRVKSWHEMEKEYKLTSTGSICTGEDWEIFLPEMSLHCGRVAVVETVNKNGILRLRIQGIPCNRTFSKNMLTVLR